VSLADLRRFADGQPVDALAAERYAEHPPDVEAVAKLCRSRDPARRKTGRLRAAAVLAAADRRPQPETGPAPQS
jgi:hypothetical protein